MMVTILVGLLLGTVWGDEGTREVVLEALQGLLRQRGIDPFHLESVGENQAAA